MKKILAIVVLAMICGSVNAQQVVVYSGSVIDNNAKINTSNTFTGNQIINGDLVYNFIHAVGSADSVNFNTGTTANYYYKINTGAFTWREADGLTGAGDSIKILTAGDYEVWCWLQATTSNTNDKIRIKLFTNNIASPTSMGRFIINSNGTGNTYTNSYMWYRTFAKNDWITIHCANITGGRAVNVTDFKLYVKKLPEN